MAQSRYRGPRIRLPVCKITGRRDDKILGFDSAAAAESRPAVVGPASSVGRERDRDQTAPLHGVRLRPLLPVPTITSSTDASNRPFASTSVSDYRAVLASGGGRLRGRRVGLPLFSDG